MSIMHDSSCLKEILKKKKKKKRKEKEKKQTLFRNLITKRSNSSLELTKLIVYDRLVSDHDKIYLGESVNQVLCMRTAVTQLASVVGHSKRLLRINKQRAFSVRVSHLFLLVLVRISRDGLSNQKDLVLSNPQRVVVHEMDGY